METMYKGISNSPQTVLAESITAEAAAIPVENINVFPEAPNLATIGSGDSAEVIRYNGIEGSRLTGCERGFGGTTANFREAGTQVYRAYTVYDHDARAQHPGVFVVAREPCHTDAPTTSSL